MSIRVITGYREIGSFLLTGDAKEACLIFDGLHGEPCTKDLTPAIRLHLVERNMPVNTILATKYCSLEQAGTNCKIITKELFKAFNLG